MDIDTIEFHPGAPLEPARQNHGAVPNPDQAADCVADRLQHAAYLPVAPFRDRDAVPTIGPFAASVLDVSKLRHAVVKAHTTQQLLLLVIAQCTQNAYCVLTFQPKAGMHQVVREFP